MKIMAIICALLVAALGVQSIRVARLQTDLAVMQGDLDAGKTREALLEADGKSLAKARDGLAAQVEDCNRANARAAEAARDRAFIVKNSRTVPAKPGEVVDDETSRSAARHINRALGR